MAKVKNLALDGYINFTPILSYTNAIFYFVDTVRNIGKTWGIGRLAWRREFKRHKKTIYVRRFKKEAKEAADSFYESVDFSNFCTGLVKFDPATKKGNFKKRGRTFYIKRCGRWEWFFKVAYVSDAQTFRSADDVACDLILYDEYTTTPEKYALYRGNEVEHFIDLVVTIARQHPIRCIFTGNKESHQNPYYSYLGITPPPSNFEGIKQYKGGSIVIYQRNTQLADSKNTAFQSKLSKALKGTPYGAYLFSGAYKREPKLKYYQVPRDANGYVQVRFKGELLKITTKGDYFYINDKPDASVGVLTDNVAGGNRLDIQINKRLHKTQLKDLEIAIAENRIRYNSAKTYEVAQRFFKYFNFIQ